MIKSRAIWDAAERLKLYALRDEELEAMIGQHHDPVITAAACYILDLRRWLAAGPQPARSAGAEGLHHVARLSSKMEPDRPANSEQDQHTDQ
jgi:hypothetical protein